MDLLELPAGAVIFNAGDPGTQAFLIRAGKVELLSGHEDTVVRVAQRETGEIFGEMSLIEERPHSLTARALTAVQLSGLTRTEFERLLTTDPATFRVYLTMLFERLRNLSAQVAAAPQPSLPTTSDVSVTIHPLSRRAAATISADGMQIAKYPFRIGRAASTHEEIPLDLNDLWLIDEIPYSISRNHAMIEREGDEVILKDRGSSLGIYVNDVHIGGNSPSVEMALNDGDNVVVLGPRMSPYQFRVSVNRA